MQRTSYDNVHSCVDFVGIGRSIMLCSSLMRKMQKMPLQGEMRQGGVSMQKLYLAGGWLLEGVGGVGGGP